MKTLSRRKATVVLYIVIAGVVSLISIQSARADGWEFYFQPIVEPDGEPWDDDYVFDGTFTWFNGSESDGSCWSGSPDDLCIDLYAVALNEGICTESYVSTYQDTFSEYISIEGQAAYNLDWTGPGTPPITTVHYDMSVSWDSSLESQIYGPGEGVGSMESYNSSWSWNYLKYQQNYPRYANAVILQRFLQFYNILYDGEDADITGSWPLGADVNTWQHQIWPLPFLYGGDCVYDYSIEDTVTLDGASHAYISFAANVCATAMDVIMLDGYDINNSETGTELFTWGWSEITAELRGNLRIIE